MPAPTATRLGPARRRYLVELLADAGYDTALVGKLHLAGASGRIEPRGDDGYRIFDWSHRPRNDWPEGHAYADWLRSQGFDPDMVKTHPEQLPPDLHQSMWCAEPRYRLHRAPARRAMADQRQPIRPSPAVRSAGRVSAPL